MITKSRCIGLCMPESLDRRMLSSKPLSDSELRELSSDIRSCSHHQPSILWKYCQIPTTSPQSASASPQPSHPSMSAQGLIKVLQVHQDKALYSDMIRTKIHLATTPGLSCLNGSVMGQNNRHNESKTKNTKTQILDDDCPGWPRPVLSSSDSICRGWSKL